jgi:hypothetical protein
MPRYSNSSLYATTKQNSLGLDILNYRQIPAKLGDKLYELKPQYNYRPDLLASDLFDDPDLWWVFKSRNPEVLDDPVFDFVAGVNIYIPTIDVIRSTIGN